MIISDLPYLDDCDRQEVSGKGQHSYSKSTAYSSYSGSFKISSLWGKYARGLNRSFLSSKHASSYSKSTMVKTSIYGNGVGASYSYAVAKVSAH